MNLGEQLDGAPGFAVFAAFTPGELKRVRELIRGHYLRRIAQVAPQHEAAFRELEMDRYHERESLVDHAVLWSNEARHLKEEAEEEIRGMSLFQPLRRAWPAMRLNRHGMYWRIVRPGNVADVGPLHADEWFWLLDGGYDAPPAGVRALKVWAGVYCEPGVSGLGVVPGSHLRSWAYHGEARHGRTKPQIDEDESKFPLSLVGCEPGRAVIFHEGLLHKGVAGREARTRVSLEFVIFVPS